jgi:hypothetical protein
MQQTNYVSNSKADFCNESYAEVYQGDSINDSMDDNIDDSREGHNVLKIINTK